jgi:A/G-specific adenine glycosylase
MRRQDEMKEISAAELRRKLLRWYDAHARALPWRRTRDPYKIWVSEIMLQQTRVAAVRAHYREFLKRFPTIEALAAAHEDQVLAAWSGLGYYRRARMLHRAARQVASGEKMPRDLEGLRALPGVGRYTAAAIGSIAFGIPAAVVDGNVERVLGRLHGKPLRNGEVWETAQALLDPRRPGDFNQAMMELGATVCLPDTPECARCPLHAMCATRGALPRTSSEVRKKKELAYALARRNGSVRLVKRGKSESLMAGMWELPQWTVDRGRWTAEPLMRLRHSITVTDYKVAVFEAPARAGKWVERERLSHLPLTGLARKILRRAGLL